jgi:hypothetical protein
LCCRCDTINRTTPHFVLWARYYKQDNTSLLTLRYDTIVIIGSTALGGPWPPHKIVASDFYPGQPSSSFYSPASLSLPPTRHSILISVGHVLVDLQSLCIIPFYVIRFRPFVRHGLPTSTYCIISITSVIFGSL